MNFGRFVKVTIVSTQGRDDRNEWVKKYRLTYSYDGMLLRNYQEDGSVKVIFPKPQYFVFWESLPHVDLAPKAIYEVIFVTLLVSKIADLLAFSYLIKSSTHTCVVLWLINAYLVFKFTWESKKLTWERLF